MAELIKLNVGCGGSRLDGYLNVDKYPSGNEDMIADICQGIPLDSGSVSEILMDNVIEHLGDIPAALAECHRLLRADGLLRVVTPHFSSTASWRDLTHLHHLALSSFDYFETGRKGHYLGGIRFRIEDKHLSFGGGVMAMFGRLIHAVSPRVWEDKFAFIFRASAIRVTLQKSDPRAAPWVVVSPLLQRFRIPLPLPLSG